MMRHKRLFQETKNRVSGLTAVAALLLLAILVIMPLQRASAAAAICYDALAGATTYCPNKTGFPIDGKAPATFAADKCYVISDVSKGWVTSDCNQNFFKTVIPVKTPDPAVDNATGNICPTDTDPTRKCDLVKQFLNPIINGLSVIVVLGVIISIIIGGIQYSAAADNPAALGAARSRVINSILALGAYMFLWSFLQWVIPGGLL